MPSGRRGYHVADERPVDAPKKWMGFDVMCTPPWTEPFLRISLEERSHQLPCTQAYLHPIEASRLTPSWNCISGHYIGCVLCGREHLQSTQAITCTHGKLSYWHHLLAAFLNTIQDVFCAVERLPGCLLERWHPFEAHLWMSFACCVHGKACGHRASHESEYLQPQIPHYLRL